MVALSHRGSLLHDSVATQVYVMRQVRRALTPGKTNHAMKTTPKSELTNCMSIVYHGKNARKNEMYLSVATAVSLGVARACNSACCTIAEV